jgi:hypothetical protein
MQTEPQQAHQRLQQLVGEWTYEADATMAPGQPPAKCEAAERVRSLGDLWILAEGQGEMPGGGAATTVLTLDTEGPHGAAEGKMAKFKDVIEFTSEDHRVLTSRLRGDDGAWHGFMMANYRRMKSY